MQPKPAARPLSLSEIIFRATIAANLYNITHPRALVSLNEAVSVALAGAENCPDHDRESVAKTAVRMILTQ